MMSRVDNDSRYKWYLAVNTLINKQYNCWVFPALTLDCNTVAIIRESEVCPSDIACKVECTK